jgi:2'-hydroxyisoflavone reductase
VKLLLLGGPKFVGRGLIDAALAAGHDVTTFNRGRTNPELYPEAERGGPILAPAPPDNPVQVIDVRDLVGWMLRMAESGETGVFNATSPAGALDFASMLEACGAQDVVWADEAFLLERDVKPWSDLPVWIPAGDPDMRYFLGADVSRAVASGLTFRPLEEAAREAPEWTGESGLSPRREAELLAEWRKVAA